MNLKIVCAVTAIGIREQIGGDHSVIEASVENSHISFFFALYLNAFQLCIPFVKSSPCKSINIEVTFVKFCFHVVLGTFGINCGDGDAHHDRLTFFRIKDKRAVMFFINGVVLHGFGELSVKIEILVAGPVSGTAEACNGGFRLHIKCRFIHKLVVNPLCHI